MENIAIRAKHITIGFGWDAYERQYSGGYFGGLAASRRKTAVDCDGSAELEFSSSAGEALPAPVRVDYKNPSALEGAVRHNGDSRTGYAEGDDETIDIDIDRIPERVCAITLRLDMLKEKRRSMTFGRVQNAFLRIIDADRGEELLYRDLTGAGERVLECGRLLRDPDGNWQYRP